MKKTTTSINQSTSKTSLTSEYFDGSAVIRLVCDLSAPLPSLTRTEGWTICHSQCLWLQWSTESVSGEMFLTSFVSWSSKWFNTYRPSVCVAMETLTTFTVTQHLHCWSWGRRRRQNTLLCLLLSSSRWSIWRSLQGHLKVIERSVLLFSPVSGSMLTRHLDCCVASGFGDIV